MKMKGPLVFFWVGFVCAISFMEAWLKFQAPGITIPLGLGIGRLVFGMMNKIEWIVALLISGTVIWEKKNLFSVHFWAFWVVVFVLLTQTFYMLPFLGERTEMVIQGHVPPPSNMHFIYIISEVVKVSALITFGMQIIKDKI